MRTKHAYAYHPETGVYLGEVECQRDQLRPGEYLIPAWSTDVKPPKPKPGKEPVWVGSEKKWKLVASVSEKSLP